MYKIMNDKSYAIATGHYNLHKKYRRNGYGTALSMYDDLRIRKNRIAGIYPSGKQQTYTVTTETGKSIVCTNNHRFPTPEGKKTLSELQVGDYLYCKGEYEVNRDKYTFTDGTFDKNYPAKGECGFRENPNGPSRVFNEKREFYKSIGAPCVLCNKQFSEDERFELHHRDHDRTNNNPDNLMWLCCSCHKKIHYKNNRKKLYDKGIPTYLDKIASIEPKAIEDTFDIEMEDPAHTFISENGLVVSNCSHAYCVALDSLYEAWIKSHYPLEFYETALKVYDAKGDKDKMSALKSEAESYFNIKFPPFRYGMDNRGIIADKEKKAILNSITAIKGFGVGIGKTLYQCSVELGSSPAFIDVLSWLDKKSIKSAKVIPLIKIDYFQEFGNETELLRIVGLFDFFQQGTSKTIKKDKLKEPLYSMVAKYATDKGVKGNELKSFTTHLVVGSAPQVRANGRD